MDAKVEKVLLQVRKGVYSGLTLSMLETIFGMLSGWTLSNAMTVIPSHLNDVIKGSGATENNDFDKKGNEHRRVYHREESETVLTAARELVKALLVSATPEKPKNGKKYVTELSEVFEKNYGGSHKETLFTATVWEGTKGYTVTEPGGTGFSFAKKPGYRVLTLDDLYSWLKTTSFPAEVLKLLGMEPHGPAPERTRENTGTCPCCFRNIKLSDAKTMVLHGYERPGNGYTIGQCVGRGYQPYELSCEGTLVIKKMAEAHKVNVEERIVKLLDGSVTSLKRTTWDGKEVTYKVGDADFARFLNEGVRAAQGELADLEWNIKFFQKMVDTWEVRPLPEVGTPVPQYEMR